MRSNVTTSGNSMTVREPDDALVDAIRREHNAAAAAAMTALDHAIEAGRLLSVARQNVKHGEWEAFVRNRCGIAERTARLYLRLDAHREVLTNRQRVAGLTVREAARLIAETNAEREPKSLEMASGDQPESSDMRIPAWYEPGRHHYGEHPSGWLFEVWPHPGGVPWVHYVIVFAPSGHPDDEGATLVGPKRGIRADRLERSMSAQCLNGMPSLDDCGWVIEADSIDNATIEAEPSYNWLVFQGDDDYRRRGLGCQPCGDSFSGCSP